MSEIITLPKPGEHQVFLGTTGSGKTELAQALLKPFGRYFAIDTQDSLTLPGSVKITTLDSLSLKLKMFKKIRYVPDAAYRNRDSWNYLFLALSKSSSKKKPVPRIVYIDEIYHLGYGPSFPDQLPIFATTARQRQLSLWIATQRPSMIPLPILTESKRIFVFYLKYEEDLKKLGKLSRSKGGKQQLLNDLIELDFDYSFIEIDGKTGDYRHLNPIKI